MKRSRLASSLILMAALVSGPARLRSADNLKLKSGLDFLKNGWQGPVILGDNMWDGLDKDKPNLIFMYGEFCYDAKRQAERTVEMYLDYGDRVHFVIVDLSKPIPTKTQVPLVKKYYDGFFPQTTIIDKNGKVLLDYTGEIDDATLIGWLDAAVRSGSDAAPAEADSSSVKPPSSQ